MSVKERLLNFVGDTIADWLERSSMGSSLCWDGYSLGTFSKTFAHKCSALSIDIILWSLASVAFSKAAAWPIF